MFTRSSVHCADRIVAIRHSSGFVKFSATCASGYAFVRALMICGARSSIGDSRVRAGVVGMADTLPAGPGGAQPHATRADPVLRRGERQVERGAGLVVRPVAVA